MRQKIAWEWERLDNATFRAKVIGGWVLLRIAGLNKVEKVIDLAELKKMHLSESMTFVPDRDHDWTIAVPLSEITIKPTVKPEDFEPKK